MEIISRGVQKINLRNPEQGESAQTVLVRGPKDVR